MHNLLTLLVALIALDQLVYFTAILHDLGHKAALVLVERALAFFNWQAELVNKKNAFCVLVSILDLVHLL